MQFETFARNELGNLAHNVQECDRSSPLSVDPNLCEATELQKCNATPMIIAMLSYVYRGFTETSELWDARFSNGSRCAPVRSLSTRHLADPSCDGWNVVAGAFELVMAWALNASDFSDSPDDPFEFCKNTRMRIAVCLSVSWKFQRSLSSNFPRRWYDENPSLMSPHTHELAYIGYVFMNSEEQTSFGSWRQDNAHNIRKLYNKMIKMEAALLKGVNVMTLLTQNVQVCCEYRIETLFLKGLISDDASMAMRSIIPLFTLTASGEKPAEGALVCAAMLCVSVSTSANVTAQVCHCPETMRKNFDEHERNSAWHLVNGALHATGNVALASLRESCYTKEQWINYPFVSSDALVLALSIATSII